MSDKHLAALVKGVQSVLLGLEVASRGIITQPIDANIEFPSTLLNFGFSERFLHLPRLTQGLGWSGLG